MGFWSLVGQQKFKVFDTLPKCNSRGGGYRVSHGSPLKMSSRTRLYGFTYVKLNDMAPVIGTNGKVEYKILNLSAYYETAQFTKREFWNRETNFAYCSEGQTGFSIVVGGGRRVHRYRLGSINRLN